MKTGQESPKEFRARLNKLAMEEESGVQTKGDSSKWLLGPTLRNHGSLHTDTWEGSAAELAERNLIGIYPVGGWWKERHQMERWKDGARYTLMVSIETDKQDVDIYTPVLSQIPIEIPVPVR